MTIYDVDHTDDDDDDDDDDYDDDRMTVMPDGADWRVRLVDSSLRHALQPMPLHCSSALHFRTALYRPPTYATALYTVYSSLHSSSLHFCTTLCSSLHSSVLHYALHSELHCLLHCIVVLPS